MTFVGQKLFYSWMLHPRTLHLPNGQLKVVEDDSQEGRGGIVIHTGAVERQSKRVLFNDRLWASLECQGQNYFKQIRPSNSPPLFINVFFVF